MLETINYTLDEPHCMPSRMHFKDAGLNLVAKTDVFVPAGCSILVDTGVHFEVPEDCFGKIEPNPILLQNYDVVSMGTVVNPGDVDSIKVKLYNFGTKGCRIPHGSNVAQIVFQECKSPCLNLVPKLRESSRGDAKFVIEVV